MSEVLEQEGAPEVALVDTHAHLAMKDFDRDREEVLTRARRAGVVTLVEVGYDLESSTRGVELARKLGLFSAVGIHPHEAGRDGSRWESIRVLALDERVVAIGEIGLDFYRNLSPRDVQIECFAQGLRLAKELSLPVIVHERGAGRETLAVLQANHPGTPIIFHCFSGDRASARMRLDIGGYLGFGGVLTYPGRHDLREALRYCSKDRILLETDCPYLPPQPKRGRRNEPSYLLYTLEEASSVLGVPREEIARISTENACRALGIALPPAEGIGGRCPD